MSYSERDGEARVLSIFVNLSLFLSEAVLSFTETMLDHQCPSFASISAQNQYACINIVFVTFHRLTGNVQVECDGVETAITCVSI